MKKQMKTQLVEIPKGVFCGGNCSSPQRCIHWTPSKEDENGRQYCEYRNDYYFPHERNGCQDKETN